MLAHVLKGLLGRLHKPDGPSAEQLCARGEALADAGNAEGATGVFHQALAARPEFAPALTGLGNLSASQGDHQTAIDRYRRAIASDPSLAAAHNNLALSLAATGHIEESWREAEWRYELPSCTSLYPRGKIGPRWGGEALAERRLLVHWEQGYGDIIQHLRFLALLDPLVPHYQFECPPPLARLAARALGPARIIESRPALPPYDVCAPLLSLPSLLGLQASYIPRLPYLQGDHGVAEQLRAKWALPAAKRLGIVWRSSRFDSSRDLGLRQLLATRCRGVGVVSLQRDITAEERSSLQQDGCIDAGSAFRDFQDTANAICAVDAVVGVDTSVTHLAGAMGRPTWLLLNEPAAVRWMLERTDSPWYPSMRLVRRPPGTPWEGRLQQAWNEAASASSHT